jgi:hypothetical protein
MCASVTISVVHYECGYVWLLALIQPHQINILEKY